MELRGCPFPVDDRGQGDLLAGCDPASLGHQA